MSAHVPPLHCQWQSAINTVYLDGKFRDKQLLTFVPRRFRPPICNPMVTHSWFRGSRHYCSVVADAKPELSACLHACREGLEWAILGEGFFVFAESLAD